MILSGIDERSCVNIIGFNAPEWAIAFFGTIFANCVATGVYATNTPEACFYQADHSEAQMLVIENEEYLKKYIVYIDKLVHLKKIVVYSDDVAKLKSKYPKV